MGTGDSSAAPDARVDVFVSYTGADEAWATWVAAVLEAEGQKVVVQVWDSPAGTNFVAWINEQMTRAARTVAICSQAYFGSHWCAQEWTGALAGNTLTPLRVADCAIPPVLATIAYRDLHGVDETTARRRLVEAVGLARPQRRSGGFPGRLAPPVPTIFPGSRAAQGTGVAAALTGPRGAVRVANADPYRLGVHRAIRLPGVDDDTLPAYVDRDIDHSQNGLRARLRTAAHRGGFLLLVGGSSVGKTRCAVEAVKAELPDWWLLRPAGPTHLHDLAATPPASTVLWLDEIQNYLNGEHGLTPATVSALLNALTPVVIVGTIWPTYYRAFTALPTMGADSYRWERDTLRLATVVDVDDQLSPAEQSRARDVAVRDPRLQAGLGSTEYGLTQTLAAAPELLRRWTSAHTDAPYAWAVLTAALDAVRLGVRSPLPAELLRAAAVDYCTPRQQATAPANWFEQALAYATTPLHGAAAALTPTSAGHGMSQLAGYTTADYLLQHATTTRCHIRPPASLWTALRDHPAHPGDLTRLIDSAFDYRVYALAVPLLRQQADTGDPDAVFQLVDLFAGAEDLDGLRQHADAGDQNATFELAWRLAEAGNRGELRRRADSGDPHAAEQLAHLFAKAGDVDGLRRRADSGDPHAAEQLAHLLAEAGDRTAAIEILRPHTHAHTGSQDAVRQLADLLVEVGDRAAAIEILRPHADTATDDDRSIACRLIDLLIEAENFDELRHRADAGNEYAAYRLAWQLVEAGDVDGLRRRADAGDPQAAECLVDVLVEAGDVDELRRRADAGDRRAAHQLAWQLAKAGDLDGLRRRADSGDPHAAEQLADLLAKAGDRTAAIEILRPHADTATDDNPGAAYRLIDLLVEAENFDELRHRADAGDDYAASNSARHLAHLLAKKGDVDGLRRRADAGNPDARHSLAWLLVEAGDVDGLRRRANAGDPQAAGMLVDVLVKARDLDELRRRANAGNPHAAGGLADLLAKAGDDRLRRFGFDVHGEIANGPTW